MSEQELQRPTSDDTEAWHVYWTALGMTWRTEPEIGKEQQGELTRRRDTIKPNIAAGVYPFKGIELKRADIEWLLAKHESLGIVGPVYWENPLHRRREGLDLRGAILTRENLSNLPLAKLQGGLTTRDFDLASADLSTREMKLKCAAIHLEHTDLTDTELQGSSLVMARMDGAKLVRAHLESADLYGVYFASSSPANLSSCVMNEATTFRMVRLENTAGIGPRLRRIKWGEVQLLGADWEEVKLLADEDDARSRLIDGKRADRKRRVLEYERAVSANRLLANGLRAQGFKEVSDKFTYRAQLCQQQVLRRQGIKKWPAYLGSLFLWALAGYGYRIWRIFFAYALVLLTFAAIYFTVGLPNQQDLSTIQAFANAVQVSLTAIHGRVFFEAFGIGSMLAWVAAVESVAGIVIEGVFVAMLIQRFFAR